MKNKAIRRGTQGSGVGVALDLGGAAGPWVRGMGCEGKREERKGTHHEEKAHKKREEESGEAPNETVEQRLLRKGNEYKQRKVQLIHE